MGQRMPQHWRELGNPLCISQMGIKKLFYIFKPIIPLLSNSLHSGTKSWEKGSNSRNGPISNDPNLGLEWEKGAQELHVFAHNWDHVYNSQMGIQIWFHICKWKIFLFKNHLHLGLTRINPKTIRIWSKWAKECLNIWGWSNENARGTHLYLGIKWVSKNYFICLNP
jgi:hypothetical protein